MADPFLEQRASATRSEIHGCDGLEDPHKDVLQEMIDRGLRASNGAPDKLQAMSEALFFSIIQQARHEVRSIKDNRQLVLDAVRECLASHNLNCPYRADLAERRSKPANLREFLLRVVENYPLYTGLGLLWALQRFGAEPVINVLKAIFGGSGQ